MKEIYFSKIFIFFSGFAKGSSRSCSPIDKGQQDNHDFRWKWRHRSCQAHQWSDPYCQDHTWSCDIHDRIWNHESHTQVIFSLPIIFNLYLSMQIESTWPYLLYFYYFVKTVCVSNRAKNVGFMGWNKLYYLQKLPTVMDSLENLSFKFLQFCHFTPDEAFLISKFLSIPS